MDPVAAIGLASAIITFIDFAHQIATGADGIYSSATGATKENAHIETVISDLDDAARDLTEISSKTKKVSEDLLQLLNTLTVSGERSTWKILKVAIPNVRKEGKVAKTLARLGEYRSEILLQLSLMLA
jgi:hypothetical protein